MQLASMGFDSTLSYVQAAAARVLRETGLLPHINAGVMGRRHVAALKQVSASQGLMLESVSERLMEPGAPHFDCPDKRPAARLATIAAAGGYAYGLFASYKF
jgi:2-iminoacetate synthase ThiH